MKTLNQIVYVLVLIVAVYGGLLLTFHLDWRVVATLVIALDAILIIGMIVCAEPEPTESEANDEL